MGRGGGWIGLDLDEAEGGGEAAAANRSRCRNGRWRRERGGLTQRRGVADRLPGGGRFLTKNCVIDAYDSRDLHEGCQVETVGMRELGTVCALFLRSFNADTLLYDF